MPHAKCGYYDPETGERLYSISYKGVKFLGCHYPRCHFIHPGQPEWKVAQSSKLPEGVLRYRESQSSTRTQPSHTPRLSSPTPSTSRMSNSVDNAPLQPRAMRDMISPSSTHDPPPPPPRDLRALSPGPPLDLPSLVPNPRGTQATENSKQLEKEKSSKQKWADRIKLFAAIVDTRIEFISEQRKCAEEKRLLDNYLSGAFPNIAAKERTEALIAKTEANVQRLATKMNDYVSELMTDDKTWLVPPFGTEERLSELLQSINTTSATLTNFIDAAQQDYGLQDQKIEELEKQLLTRADAAVPAETAEMPPAKRRRMSNDETQDIDMVSAERHDGSRPSREELKATIATLEEQMEELTLSLEQQRLDTAELKDKVDHLSPESSTEEKGRLSEEERAQLEDRFVQLRVELETLINGVQSTVQEHASEIQVASTVLPNYQERIEGLEAAVTLLRQENEALESERSILKAEVEGVRHQMGQQLETLYKRLDERQKQWNEQLMKLERMLGNNNGAIDALSRATNAIASGSHGLQESILEQVAQKLRAELVPDILGPLLQQVEGNVVQRLMPKINPTLVLVEEIYSFMKRVEAQNARPPAGAASTSRATMPPPPARNPGM